ncbi:MAG: hypothetical protein AAF253_06560 [Pseudomonadota bacterium]
MSRLRPMPLCMSAASLLATAGCTLPPKPLGAAHAANTEIQAVTPSGSMEDRGPLAGGTGGRAGLPVKALRDGAKNSGEGGR